MIDIVECPRDAMQGLTEFIPTAQKIDYLQQLININFHTLDFGSFVSPKAIPQMADTKEIIEQLDLSKSTTQLLAIVANLRGAEEAVQHSKIKYIGFPFSISETFQQRNTNSSITESLATVAQLQELCVQYNKELVIYISMAFGNPYNDAYSPEIATAWSLKIAQLGVKIISLSDTIGIASPFSIKSLFENIQPALPEVKLGVHLHTEYQDSDEKIEVAYLAGCTRFDGAIGGYGGCPMATNKLTGNMPTEKLVKYFLNKNLINLDLDLILKAQNTFQSLV